MLVYLCLVLYVYVWFGSWLIWLLLGFGGGVVLGCFAGVVFVVVVVGDSCV